MSHISKVVDGGEAVHSQLLRFTDFDVNQLTYRLSSTFCWIYTQQKKFLDTYKSSIFTKILHIIQIKSLLCEAGECPLYFDTKLEGIGW